MKTPKLLAVASEGGHWIQLMRLKPAFANADVEYLSTNSALSTMAGSPIHVVADANLWTKWRMLVMFLQVAIVIYRVRPNVIITTGAAPGLAAIIIGRLVGARTLWLDSIANSEILSGSGQQARRFAHVCLTQWPDLAEVDQVQYWGRVL